MIGLIDKLEKFYGRYDDFVRENVQAYLNVEFYQSDEKLLHSAILRNHFRKNGPPCVASIEYALVKYAMNNPPIQRKLKKNRPRVQAKKCLNCGSFNTIMYGPDEYACRDCKQFHELEVISGVWEMTETGIIYHFPDLKRKIENAK